MDLARRTARRLTPAVRRMAPALLQGFNRRYMGGGGYIRQPVGGPVTRQHDFSAGGSIVQNRRKRKRNDVMSRIRRKRARRFRIKVKRAIGSPKNYVKFYTSIGRSWKSIDSGQSVAIIPIVSYRGEDTTTASIANNGAPSNQYLFRQDDIASIYQYFDAQLFPAALAANSIMKNSWFKVKRGTVDISMTNVGSVETVSTACAIEYEAYLIWPRKMIQDPDIPYTLPEEWINQARNWSETRVGADALLGYATAAVAPGDPAWKITTSAYLNTYMGSKLIGRGYIALGETVRIVKHMKCKGFISKKQFIEEDSAAAAQTRPFKRGMTSAVMVIWRGTPITSRATGGYGPSRLLFNINKEIDVVSPAYGGTRSQRMDTYLYLNNFA